MRMAPPPSLLRKTPKRQRAESKKDLSVDASYRLPPGVIGMDHEGALQVIKEAMETLPAEETAAYRQASLECPAQIWEESPPACYLEFEGGDANAAAIRLAAYWKLRFAHFGAERAVRRMMDLSGSGCLNQEDLQVMKLGIMVPLPTDKQGRMVLFVDQTRLPPNSPARVIERIRCIFFYHHLAYYSASSPDTWRKGITFIRMLNKAIFSKDGVRMLAGIRNDAFPIQNHPLHMCCLPPPDAAGKRAFWNWVTPVADTLMQSLSKPIVHRTETSSDVLQALLQHGFEKESLPAIAGGDWSYSKFYLWLQQKQLHGFTMAPMTKWELSLDASQEPQRKKQELELSQSHVGITSTAVDNCCNTISDLPHLLSAPPRTTSARSHRVPSTARGRITARKSMKNKLDVTVERRNR